MGAGNEYREGSSGILHRILEGLGGDVMARVRFGDEGGVIFDVEDPVSKALAWFEELFSAMQEAGGEEAAKQGWAMLHILTVALASGVNVSADLRQRTSAAGGGKKTAEILKERARMAWQAEALRVAKVFVASNPKYSQDELASHIEHMCDPPVGHAQIISVISKWQKDGDILRSRKQVHPYTYPSEGVHQIDLEISL